MKSKGTSKEVQQEILKMHNELTQEGYKHTVILAKLSNHFGRSISKQDIYYYQNRESIRSKRNKPQ